MNKKAVKNKAKRRRTKMFKEAMCLIVTIVYPGYSADVINASKKAGADGATILSGRGTSVNEQTVLLGVPIQPEKEMVLTLVKKSLRKNVMKEIVKTCNLNTEGKGITFSLPVDEISGAPHLFKKYKREQEKKQKEAQKTKRAKEQKEKAKTANKKETKKETKKVEVKKEKTKEEKTKQPKAKSEDKTKKA